jgi:HK97 family phage major capsid protein
MADTVKGLGAKLAEKQKQIQDFLAAHKSSEADRPYDMTQADVEQVRSWNEELKEIGESFTVQKELASIEAKSKEYAAQIAEPVRLPFASQSGMPDHRPVKSMGDLFCENYYTKDGGNRFGKDIAVKGWGYPEFKTTMTTAAGFAPEHPRSGKVQLSAQRPIKVPDILPTITMSTDNTYVYMLESTFTNNAAEASENSGSAWGEAALAFTETSQTIQKIATFLPVTDEQLADAPGMADLVNNRLSLMVMLRLDSQLLNGDGNTPNIAGFYNQVTQTQALGADPQFDAIFKAMTKVRWTGMADPTAIVLHPNDWQDIRLLRTTEGIYILGNPADPGPERLFGVPVVVTSAALENTGLVGDFATHSAMVVRQGIEFKVSDSHSDYFVKGLQAVRATMRACLVVFRASAFCEITSL